MSSLARPAATHQAVSNVYLNRRTGAEKQADLLSAFVADAFMPSAAVRNASVNRGVKAIPPSGQNLG